MTDHSPETDTIVACATAVGVAGVAVVRVSGPLSQSIASALVRKKLTPRYAQFGDFYSPAGEVIDQGLVLFFKGPHSFTGEDVLELQGHGGRVVVQQVIDACIHAGARMAEPGEFSKRAFLNNRMDLVQAEAIADLISAQSMAAAKGAMRSLKGEFSHALNNFREQLIQCRLYLEAHLDFPEEELVDDNTSLSQLSDQFSKNIEALCQTIHTLLITSEQGAKLQAGATVVIAGLPNAGKSSLLNALSGYARAIVSDIPGTTRDHVSEDVLLSGLNCRLIDTAGIHDTQDDIEKMGVSRAKALLKEADLIVWVIDVNQLSTDFETDVLSSSPDQLRVLCARQLQIDLSDQPVLLVINKVDLADNKAAFLSADFSADVVAMSARDANTQFNLCRPLQAAMLNILQVNNGAADAGAWSARQRHCDALRRCQQLLTEAKDSFSKHAAWELLAEDCRQAQLCVDEITGRFTPDDLLGRVFSTFCIGK